MTTDSESFAEVDAYVAGLEDKAFKPLLDAAEASAGPVPQGGISEEAVEATARAVWELFGGCDKPTVSSSTQEAFNCGRCGGCRRDWANEARAILAAALPALRAAIADEVSGMAELISWQGIEQCSVVIAAAARVVRGGTDQ